MDVKKLVSQMTLEEKAGICSGASFWFTKAVERLGVPAFMMTDGPHGLRKQDQSGDHLGINDSIKAVCFPTGSAVAASFDRALIREMAEALGDACQAEDVAVCLGPAVNIKRSPLCGRNFEYLSEDPYLTGEMAIHYIRGMQSKNVGVSMKHYLANNQEHRRMTSSSEADERTLREIYLAAFESAVKEAKPWTVMCSYNRVNGQYVSHSPRYLTEILRGEWGFDGFVVSDWGAVREKVPALSAGMDLEMPASGGISDAKVVAAVQSGELDEAVVDKAAERILTILYRFAENRDANAVFDRDQQHELAARIASESMVLLKNDGLLPLDSSKKIAFIGKFAEKPRFQGGGSSHINAHKVTSALDAVARYAQVTYAQGYDTVKDETDEALLAEAVAAAKEADIAVVFAGLPDAFESEGYDRKHMRLPCCQDKLIAEVLDVQPNTVIVLHNGSPVEMPWAAKTPAILEAYLCGQAVGTAVTDILFGTVNPSGKLAETFPIKLEDNPSYLYFTGEADRVEYREGVFVGYRYYDTKKAEVLFPFGHGLSYTTFDYSNITVSADAIQDTDNLTVTADVTNTGLRAGKEIVQLYVGPGGMDEQNGQRSANSGGVIRPVRELKGFEKVSLNPGETKTVTFVLNKRSFAYFCMQSSDWRVQDGDYTLCMGGSSRDLPLKKTVHITSSTPVKPLFTIHSTIGDLMSQPAGQAAIKPVLDGMAKAFGGGDAPKERDNALGEGTAAMMEAMMRDMPISAVMSFGGGQLTEEMLQGIIAQANA